ncbi:undecaprenyl-phosphate glucose phosphotransferase [Paraburkholderia sp. J41]|uniref:undecaprenyl-phosphate glucose phosphotransferase n=1 Tax=Paraburkholderia sp. J41 TaxID=2805433 RepID=UPI002AC3472E|nr:undecaprenyl-phosphate glucose phosphotransferase [Paraburkholderia sp. J41]
MHLPAQSYANTSPRHGNALARASDIFLIALSALISARAAATAVSPGYDNALVAFALLLSVLLFPAFGLYQAVYRPYLLRCVLAPVFAWVFALAGALLAALFVCEPYRPDTGWMLRWALLSGIGITVRRHVCAELARRRAEQGTRAVAIVGSGERCRQLLYKVESTPGSMYLVSTTFDTGVAEESATGSTPAFRDRLAFADYVRRYQVKEVWLALPLSEEKTILEFIELFRTDLVDIRFIPDVSGMALFDGEMVDLAGTSAINLVGSPLSSDALAAKEIFDRIFAFCAVVALSPLLAAIALAVKLSSRGPVLFTQKRKGANGKVFDIYKFRSMRVHDAAEGVVKQATRNDPRITRVGAFLRRTSLDELPQFFNVLRGEMSVVGPRPHAIEHDRLYQNIVDNYIHRYRIKPGITGWAQVNGFRGETDRIEKMQGRVEHDLFYLSNWSFAFDMRIVVATVFKGLVHSNAY